MIVCAEIIGLGEILDRTADMRIGCLGRFRLEAHYVLLVVGVDVVVFGRIRVQLDMKAYFIANDVLGDLDRNDQAMDRLAAVVEVIVMIAPQSGAEEGPFGPSILRGSLFDWGVAARRPEGEPSVPPAATGLTPIARPKESKHRKHSSPLERTCDLDSEQMLT